MKSSLASTMELFEEILEKTLMNPSLYTDNDRLELEKKKSMHREKIEKAFQGLSAETITSEFRQATFLATKELKARIDSVNVAQDALKYQLSF